MKSKCRMENRNEGRRQARVRGREWDAVDGLVSRAGWAVVPAPGFAQGG